ncbi:YcgL domain-containing protein [Ferrimonas lipolytica]|uniref:YcgL domain-containing protein HER31_07550 n=1 Tax=Ferrimonas lipolytica TaxID=2724191 RepID=A0A6H1UIA8_9GAMM|nr:YcgL domain-containing protein [Ferrimonas lipolytica]QIZ78845.1 YcgL domain-containing protein [Ferrimonas lipolytica]
MICAVYKSSKKAETYLYVNKRDDFSSVPQPLMDIFGVPKFVMLLPMIKLTKLANVDLNKLKSELDEKGFFLQLPPPEEDLLKQHRKDNGLDANPIK